MFILAGDNACYHISFGQRNHMHKLLSYHEADLKKYTVSQTRHTSEQEGHSEKIYSP